MQKRRRRERREGQRENRFTLSRDIPDPVKLQVRQACGFGCVLCGKALVHYDHFDVEFKDAHTHDHEKIVLLCAGHHDEKTRKWLSADAIRKARAAPAAKVAGFAHQAMDCGNGDCTVYLGQTESTGQREVLRVHGKTVIGFNEPEVPGAPNRLSAIFYDEDERLACQIVDNEIRAMTHGWDVDIVGPTVTIRRGPGDIALMFTALPGKGFRIDRMRSTYQKQLIIVQPDGRLRINTFSMIGGGLFHAAGALISVPRPGVDE